MRTATAEADKLITDEERSLQAALDLRVVVFSDACGHRNGVGAYYDNLLSHLAPHVDVAELVCPGITETGVPQGLSIPLPSDNTQRLCLPGIPKAVNIMRRVRPHVVVIATPGPYGLLGVLLGKLFGAPLCVGYHTQYDKLADLYWNRVFGSFSRRFLNVLDRMLFRQASVVVANSIGMYESAIQMGAGDVRLVGTPIEPRLLTPPVPLKSETLGPVVFVGRLAHEKRLDLFLETAKELPYVQFIVAGDGPLSREVVRAERELENLSYRGWLDREAVLHLLDESEILALPSQVEAFGTVVTEAMARERLAIVSEHCGVVAWPDLASGVEILHDGERLSDKIDALAALPAHERAQKRRLARQRCLDFAHATIEHWCDTLTGIAREESAGQRVGAEGVG